MVRRSIGFTLVELMVVIAVIALLAAIALPSYQKYVAKAQIGAALYEIRAGETAIEYLYQDGGNFFLVNANYIGLRVSRRCSSVSADLSDGGAANISCAVVGNAKVNGLLLSLRRSSDGVWTCDAGAFDLQLRPAGCL